MTRQELIDFEKGIAARFDNGEIPYLIHLSGGNEDQLIEIFKEINPGDWIFSTHRSHYHYLLAGGSPEKLENMILNGKSMFVFDKDLNFYSSSIVCGSAAIAAGVAWALKRKNSDRRVWCFLGDGAEDEGHLYEAARYVDGFNLPCTFIVEDNDRSVNASKKERWGNRPFGMSVNCVKWYSYVPTYPHSGSGTGGWLQFKKEARVIDPPDKEWLDIIDLPALTKYKDAVKQSMEMLADKGYIFVGYNVKHGSAYGMLADVPEEQRLETPVAENLMAGLAMGMSLEGFRSVLFFERHDFIFNALDLLVNQLDKIEIISDGQYRFPVIIKAVAGSVKPFYGGPTHTSDMSRLFADLFNFPVFFPKTPEGVLSTYTAASEHDGPVLISEKKELYE